MAKLVDKLEVHIVAGNREAEILFDLLDEIRRLKEWRFEHCKHKTGWCQNKENCESCLYARTGGVNDKT